MIVKLGDIADIASGGGAPQGAQYFGEAGTPFIRAGSLPKLLAGEREVEQDLISEEVAREHRLRLFPRGTILFAKSGMSATKGHVYQLKESAYVVNHLAAIIAGKKLNADYFRHWLHVYQPRRLIKDAAYPSIRLSDIQSIEIPLPPLEEQRRIAEVLDRADALRQKRRLALQKLDTLLQSVFLEMFGDSRTNPKRWKQSPLGSLCDIGSSKRVFVEDLVEEGVPFYRGTEVGSLGDGVPITPTLFITNKHYDELKQESGVPRPGDLLLPSICPDGRIYIVRDEKPFYFKDGRVLWIKAANSGINSTFLRHHLKHLFAADYAKIASGTTFAELKIFALKALVVHVPPTEQQIRFERFVERCDRQMSNMSVQLTEINSFFASLQARAFNGGFNAR